MSDRGRFFINVIKIMRELMSHHYGLSTGELAERCALDRRTVQRYLGIMTSFLPISEDSPFGDKRRKRYRLETRAGDSGMPQVVFGLEEIVALTFYRSLLPDTRDLPFHDELTKTFEKLRLALKPGLTPYLDRLGRIFTCYEKNYKSYHRHRDTILTLTRAILTRNTIRLTYHAFQSDSVRKYRIDPLCLFFYDGGLYMTGYVHGIRSIWNFAIERLTDLELLSGVTFEPPAPGTLEDRAGTAFRIYSQEPFRSRFRFPPHMRPYVVERSWHPSQLLHSGEDGSVELTFFAGGDYDLKRWALSFGPDIEVLEPESLRRAVADELRRAAELYRSDSG